MRDNFHAHWYTLFSGGNKYTARYAPSYLSKPKLNQDELRMDNVSAGSVIINFQSFVTAKHFLVRVQKQLRIDDGSIARALTPNQKLPEQRKLERDYWKGKEERGRRVVSFELQIRSFKLGTSWPVCCV